MYKALEANSDFAILTINLNFLNFEIYALEIYDSSNSFSASIIVSGTFVFLISTYSEINFVSYLFLMTSLIANIKKTFIMKNMPPTI